MAAPASVTPAHISSVKQWPAKYHSGESSWHINIKQRGENINQAAPAMAYENGGGKLSANHQAAIMTSVASREGASIEGGKQM